MCINDFKTLSSGFYLSFSECVVKECNSHCKFAKFLALSDFGLSGHSPMAFLDPTFWTASCFGLSVFGLRLFGLWPL